MLAGYALVLLMGAGNYVGTRFALPALLAAAAILTVPVSMSSLHWLPARGTARAGATVLLGIAAWLASLIAKVGRRSPSPDPVGAVEGIGMANTPTRALTVPFDALLADFRNLYGIVWARRVLDRINETAARDSWPVRLQLQGFVPVDPSCDANLTPEQSRQIEHAVRWLLRRFVDPEWIDDRLSERGA